MGQLAEVRKAIIELTETPQMEEFLLRQTKEGLEEVFNVVDTLDPITRDIWYVVYAKTGRLYKT